AKLHLHLIDALYTANDLSALDEMVTVFNVNIGKRIHILTGFKSIAKSLIKNNLKDAKLSKAIQNLKAQLITGDDDTPFNESVNNIGTTFKTGIDIKDNNSVFIILLPCISDQGNYGIFSDGLPSIIQSFARI